MYSDQYSGVPGSSDAKSEFCAGYDRKSKMGESLDGMILPALRISQPNNIYLLIKAFDMYSSTYDIF